MMIEGPHRFRMEGIFGVLHGGHGFPLKASTSIGGSPGIASLYPHLVMKTGVDPNQFSGEEPQEAMRTTSSFPKRERIILSNDSPKGPKLRESPMMRTLTGSGNAGGGRLDALRICVEDGAVCPLAEGF
jgi:hypothetical protein